MAAVAISSLALSACGGGGGGGGTGGTVGASTAAPYILAGVISFPTGSVPPGFVSPASNSLASVQVLNSTSNAPITNASASVNGVALVYNAANQDYEAEMTVAPGGSIAVNVMVNGTTYTVSGTQFTAYPTISSPSTNATWSSATANLVAWSGVAPTPNSLYELGILDTSGQLVWPSGNNIESLPTTTTSYSINAGSLTAGSRFLIVGLATFVAIPNAAANSGIVIGGFNYDAFTVTSGTTASLVSVAVTPNNPTVTNGKSLQLTATGTYSDNSTQDLTTQVTWMSSDTTKATVSSTGLLTGINYGSATVTAKSGGISGATVAEDFQPNPSPSPPLSQSVAYQIDYAHSGYASFTNPISFPASPTWSVTLNGAVSYPLIAGGKVFVITGNPGASGTSSSLYALDEQTGSIVWGPIAISGLGVWSSHAYDNGTLFVINFGGVLRSFSAATGQAGWSTTLPGLYSFNSPPTAANGIVYVGGGNSLFALDESNGNVLWANGVMNGDNSSPAVSSDGVFVSYPCQVYKFDPITGSSLWHYSGGCSGGGGRTPAYANGLLYVRDPSAFPGGHIFDATAGTQVGNFTATPIPAISPQTSFFLNAGTLQAIDLSSHNVVWSFVGDGALVLAPIVIDKTVIVGSSSGNVYALDASTGSQIWSENAGSTITAPNEQGLSELPGFGAGDGYLVVPAGNVLTAWHISN